MKQLAETWSIDEQLKHRGHCSMQKFYEHVVYVWMTVVMTLLCTLVYLAVR
ncbi:MAG: hypothetical protein MRJ96_14820 [Nitrospirales bacterium]|nr:hypothetical protein [Nitrospira sp.]MDR4502715.1 hypothetical protein [Nitrospirales bacterium]